MVGKPLLGMVAALQHASPNAPLPRFSAASPRFLTACGDAEIIPGSLSIFGGHHLKTDRHVKAGAERAEASPELAKAAEEGLSAGDVFRRAGQLLGDASWEAPTDKPAEAVEPLWLSGLGSAVGFPHRALTPKRRLPGAPSAPQCFSHLTSPQWPVIIPLLRFLRTAL